MSEYYTDYDEASGSYCVFNTESSKALASFSSKEQAQDHATKLNGPVCLNCETTLVGDENPEAEICTRCTNTAELIIRGSQDSE